MAFRMGFHCSGAYGEFDTRLAMGPFWHGTSWPRIAFRQKALSRLVLLAPVLLTGNAAASALTAGPGQEYPNPSAAAQAARDGDTVRIEAGTYYDCAVWSQNHLTITGAGPETVITDTTCLGKALFVVTGNDVTIRDLTLARARVPDLNGAGIRMEGQGLTLERLRFVNDEAGLLAASTSVGAIRISDCVFEAGGRGGERPTFAVSVSAVSLLRIEHSTFNGVKGGQIKTAADRTELVGNQIGSGTGAAPAVAIMATGGGLIIEDNVLSIGPNAPRSATAVLAMGRGPLTLRRDRMENGTGQRLALLFNWTGTNAQVEGDQVGQGDRVLSRSGLWRHRASRVYHRTKDTLRHVVSLMIRGLRALVGR